ncbi:hypothetical protein Anapl_11333, partial [Anas platyrhynchos]
CAGGGEREMEHVMSVMFVSCGNSTLLNVFFLSDAHICYFKYPSILHRIQ